MGEQVQRFSVTSTRVMGGVGVAIAVAVVVLVLLDGGSDPSYTTIALMVLLAALAWCTMIRPRVEVDSTRLVLHNMVSTVVLPLAAIESVAVRQVLVVRAGDRRFASAGVGRTRRQLHRDNRSGGAGSGGGAGGMLGLTPSLSSSEPERPETAATSYGLFVEERIRALVSDAVAREGVRPGSDDQERLARDVVRRPAVPEIVVLAGSLVVVVALLVG